jgi:hypothetical protein
MAGNHFMSVTAASKEVGLGKSMLYHWIGAKKIPTKTEDGVIQVSLDAVKAYDKSRREDVSPVIEGKVLSMQVTDAPVKLPGRERSASSSLVERRKKILVLAKKMLSKDKALTGVDLHKKAKEMGISVGNRIVYEMLNSVRTVAADKKEAKTPASERYGTFEYFCRQLRSSIEEHRITSIQMALDNSGDPKLTIRREQVVTL